MAWRCSLRCLVNLLMSARCVVISPLSLLMLVICAFTLLFQFYSMSINCFDLLQRSSFWLCGYSCIFLIFLSFTSAFTYLVEKAMAPHSSTLAWKIPWMEEPGGLQSIGLLRVRHDWATSFSLFTFLHWRRKWQPTPVFLPGESQGRGSLVGCHLWGRTESDMTEAT